MNPHTRLTRTLYALAVGLPALALLALLTLPLLALLASTPHQALLDLARNPHATQALRLSLLTTTLSTALAVTLGTPLAWLLAAHPSRASRWIASLVELPLVLPPLVSGLALLVALGPHGPLAPLLHTLHLRLPFSTAAVVLAQLTTAAPLYVLVATSAFQSLDPDLLHVARSLGAPPWRLLLQIALPLAFPALLNAAALAWARALGEFGATLLFAGNVPGTTQTLPLLVYTTLEADLHAAQAVAALLALTGYTLLLLLRRPFQPPRTP